MTWDDFMALPALSQHFPFECQNGTCWESFWGYCGDCDRKVSGDMLRGTLEVTHDYRGNNEIRSLLAHGYCKRCQKITSYRYLLHSDLTLEGERDGKVVTWGPSKMTRWEKLCRWVKGLFLHRTKSYGPQ